MRWLCATSLVMLTACPTPPERLVVDGGARLRAAGAGDAGWALTEPLLDAWLGYQRTLSNAPVAADAGARDAVKFRMRVESLARADAGLSEGDVDRIEDIVAAVITQRNLAKLTGADAVRDLERATMELTAEQKAQTEKALADLKARTQQVSSLAEERARFGEEAVRVVLTRESEVTKTWDSLLEARSTRPSTGDVR